LTGIALVNLATLTWAANMTLGRWLRDDIGPVTLAAARFLIASAGYAVLLQRRSREERRLGTDWMWLLAMGISGVALFAPTLYLGLHFTTTINATLINALGPLLTGVLAALMIGEPMKRRQVIGAVFAILGVTVLLSGGSDAFWRSANLNKGDLIMVAAIALWSTYSVLSRRVTRHRSALSASALSGFLGLPFLLMASARELTSSPVNLTPSLVLAVLFIGVFPSLVGFLAWNEGIRRLTASGAMVFYNTLPLYGTLLGVLLLGETVGVPHLLGGFLIVSGGLWASRSTPSGASQPVVDDQPSTRQDPE
jgi:drug/metabolite transporter (DMT)-like permease